MERTYTFCLNMTKADPDTYLTWVTVRFSPDGTMLKLSNAEGNGQKWTPFGAWDANGTKLVSFLDRDTDSTRIVATILKRKGYEVCGASTYGASYPAASVVNVTGQRFTAATSIAAGRVVRDKNRNVMRERIEAISGGVAHLPNTGGNVDAMNAKIQENFRQEMADKKAKRDAKRAAKLAAKATAK